MNAEQLAATFAGALAAAGTRVVFGIPGGGNNLEVVGAVQAAGLTFVLAHGETAATIMAAVYADVTGVPSAVVVTRGPGAASAVNGAAQALLDRQPVIVLTDTVAMQERSRIYHQRVDQRALFRPVTKGSAGLGSVEPGRAVAEALRLAAAHPRGPVHLEFDPTSQEAPGLVPPPAADTGPDDGELDAIRALLSRARRPVVLLGLGTRDVGQQVRELLAGSDAPVLMTYRAKGVVPESWDNCAGLLTGAAIERAVLDAADAILAIGLDTVELIPAEWSYPAPLVSISSWPDTSAYLRRAHEIVGDLADLVRQLNGCLAGDWEPGSGQGFRRAGLDLLLEHPRPVRGVAPQELVRRARALAPAGTIATIDAGAHMLAVLPLWETQEKDEAIVSSGLATMGFALPAAIAAALAFPERRIVCFVGDGGLGMVLAELETLVRLRLRVTVVVFNDSRLSLIAVKQTSERHGGETAVAYDEINFAWVAAGFGLAARVVSSSEELDEAIMASLSAAGPHLLDVRVDPDCYPAVLGAIRGPRQRGSAARDHSTDAPVEVG
jgi:acetolactate synthase-1/2/3 large subunit